MVKTFTTRSRVKLFEQGRVSKHTPYGDHMKGVMLCPVCHNVFYKKAWHHAASKSPALQNLLREKKVSLHLCPACAMARDHLYEGELLLENVPDKVRVELLRFITAYTERSQKRDPQDRILAIEETATGYRILTSENQLALKLGKKVQALYKTKAELSIAHSKEPFEFNQARVTFNK